MMNINKKSIEKAIKTIKKPWTPVEIARFNNQVMLLALFEGEYYWHTHPDAEEVFYVYRGAINIQLKKKPDIIIQEGELAVVPRRVAHCSKSNKPSYVLMIARISLDSKGN